MPKNSRSPNHIHSGQPSLQQLELPLELVQSATPTAITVRDYQPQSATQTESEIRISPARVVSTTDIAITSRDMQWFKDEIFSRHTAISALAAMAANLELLVRVNEVSGKAVTFLPSYGFLPILVGRDQQPIPLYSFVEVLDEATDYDQVQAAFPALSFGQISSAIAFLRKLVQFNTKGIDIDQLEDVELESSEAFRADLKQALADQEVTRVLTANQRNG